MNKKEAENITIKLIKNYPEAKCSLDFSTPFQMLVAVCLSAQCTDERVNQVTKTLFKRYSTPEDFANANVEDIEKLIYSCGFYKNKARNLVNAGKKVCEDYNGIVPDNMEELMKIPGVGRKSANVIMLEAFNKPQGIAVDTHVKRISKRIGFSNEKEPEKIEQDLLKEIPKKYWKDVNHVFIYHGRNTCKSQNPQCENCVIKDCCNYYTNLKK